LFKNAARGFSPPGAAAYDSRLVTTLDHGLSGLKSV
jgi:hypothetical protein